MYSRVCVCVLYTHREFVTLLSKALTAQEAQEGGLELFESSDSFCLYPNKQWVSDADKLRCFEFVGRFMAKCLLEDVLLDFRLARLVYKRLLKQKLDYKDIKSVDKDFYEYQILWMADNDIEDVIYQTFSVEQVCSVCCMCTVHLSELICSHLSMHSLTHTRTHTGGRTSHPFVRGWGSLRGHECQQTGVPGPVDRVQAVPGDGAAATETH
jgi:hypothetical protein